MKNQKNQEIMDWRTALLAAQFLWDLEENGVGGNDPTLTFTWRGDWSSYSGQFVIVKRLVRHMVTVSWRCGRPPKRPPMRTWSGTGSSGIPVSEAQEDSR